MNYSPPTHPESPRQLIGRSFALYSHIWPHVFFLGFLLSVTTFLPRVLSLLAGQDIISSLPLLSIQRGWIFLMDLMTIILFVAILWRIRCVLFHVNEEVEDDLIVGFKKTPSIFIAAFLQTTLMMVTLWALFAFVYYIVLNQSLNFSEMNWRNYVAFLLIFLEMAILLFIFLSFYFFLALIVLENKSILGAFKKSYLLMRHHWWETLCVQAVPWLTYLLLLLLFRYVIQLNVDIFFIPHLASLRAMDVLFQIFIFAVFLPWIGATLIIQLKDLELRRLIQLRSETVNNVLK